MGSMLIIPFAILMLLSAIWSGLSAYWIWLVGGLVYGLIIWGLTAVLPRFAAKCLVSLTLALLPTACLLISEGFSWQTFFVGALALSVFGGIASQGSARYSLFPRNREPENFYHKTKENIRAFGWCGVVLAAQAVWLAPAAFASLDFNLFAVFTTLVGMIATFFVVDELEMPIGTAA